MKTTLFIFLLALSVSVVTETEHGKELWAAFAYPDKNDLNLIYHLETYVTPETCILAAKYVLQAKGWTDTGAYGCGRDCGYYPENFYTWGCRDMRR